MDVVVSSAWPIIVKSLRVDISFIGVLVMISYMGSISISPNTYRVRQKIGTNYTMILTFFLIHLSKNHLMSHFYLHY